MLMHLNPWSLFDAVERSLIMPSSPSLDWPQFDIEDTEDETILTADMPGMTEEDVDITVSGPYLVVRGERRPKQGRYLRQRRLYGTFERRFWIGDGYDVDRVQARLADGELAIRLTKTERSKPRRIPLGSGRGALPEHGSSVASRMRGLLTGRKEKKQAV